MATYLGGYARLRLRHDFVHDATYYTGFDGRAVHTDAVRLGEWRWSPMYFFLDDMYQPVRWAEGLFWRLWAAHQDGGRASWKGGPDAMPEP